MVSTKREAEKKGTERLAAIEKRQQERTRRYTEIEGEKKEREKEGNAK